MSLLLENVTKSVLHPVCLISLVAWGKQLLRSRPLLLQDAPLVKCFLLMKGKEIHVGLVIHMEANKAVQHLSSHFACRISHEPNGKAMGLQMVRFVPGPLPSCVCHLIVLQTSVIFFPLCFFLTCLLYATL